MAQQGGKQYEPEKQIIRKRFANNISPLRYNHAATYKWLVVIQL